MAKARSRSYKSFLWPRARFRPVRSGALAAVVAAAWVLSGAVPAGHSARTSPIRPGELRAAAQGIVPIDGCGDLGCGDLDGVRESDFGPARAAWFASPRVYPQTFFPAGALLRARWQALERLPQAEGSERFERPFARFAPFRGPFTLYRPVDRQVLGAWTSYGPAPLCESADCSGQAQPYSGRITAIATDPTAPGTLYVGTPGGGVWRTRNGGQLWTPLFDSMPTLAIGALALDPQHHATIFAGTGNAGAYASYLGLGLFRSHDQGNHWSRVGGNQFDGCAFNDVRIHPADSDLMVAAVSTDPTYSGPATPCVGGVYVSTNGGTTWTRWLARDQVDDVSFGGMRLLPVPFGTHAIDVFAGVRDEGLYRGEIVLWPNGAYGPGTWQQVAGGLPTSGMSGVSVAVAPSDPSRLYAMLGLPEGSPSDLLGAWTSADGGQSWTAFTPPHASWLGLALQVDPANARTLYVGSGWVWRIDDAGGSSTIIADTSKIHIDVRALAFDAAHRLYIATDGGLVSTLDDQTFTSANGNLAISQVYPGVSGTLAGNGALAPGGPFLAGLQDNGTARFDGPQVWHAVGYGGDGGFTAIDPTHVNTQYVTAQDLTVFKTDDGANFSGAGDSRWATEPTLWIAPLVMDTSHPDHLYAGTDKVYRSINAASSWDPISPAFGYTDKISAIAPAASDEQVVYAGTTELGIETTGDGGTDWTSGAGLPERSVNDIAVNPSNASEAWAALGGFGSGHLFHTTDEGQTWTDISGDLPDSPVNAVAVDTRYHPALIFVGTDVGVFLATQGSTRWAISGGLPNSPVTDLLVDRSTNQLVAATYGRGVWASTERRYLRFRRPPAIGSPRPIFGGFGG